MTDIIIDKDKCISCLSCIRICPMGVYENKEGSISPVNINYCINCHACEVVCPVDAIALKNLQ